MKQPSKKNQPSTLKYSLSIMSIFLSTTSVASEPVNQNNYLFQLHQDHGSLLNTTQPPLLLAWGRPEGVGGGRPANAPAWGDGTGTRPEGVGGSRPSWATGDGTRPEGAGGNKPANAPTWGDGTDSPPEGFGGSRPKWNSDS